MVKKLLDSVNGGDLARARIALEPPEGYTLLIRVMGELFAQADFVDFVDNANAGYTRTLIGILADEIGRAESFNARVASQTVQMLKQGYGFSGE